MKRPATSRAVGNRQPPAKKTNKQKQTKQTKKNDNQPRRSLETQLQPNQFGNKEIGFNQINPSASLVNLIQPHQTAPWQSPLAKNSVKLGKTR